MITRRIVAMGSFAIALTAALGCSSTTVPIGASDEPYTSVANGLWALEGAADHGDIELLQLAPQTFASIVREEIHAPAEVASEEPPEAEPGAEGPGRASAGRVTEARRSATGDVARTRAAGATAPAISLLVGDQSIDVVESGDLLTLTKPDGRVLTYTRSYGLYCVPTARGVEATVILELGKEPLLVGVNGDGHLFPKAGVHPAVVRTDILFRLHDYEVISHIGASTVIVKLPWSEMSKPEMEGTLALVGPADAALPTPITCERVLLPSY